MTKPIDQLNKEDKQVLDSVVERSNKNACSECGCEGAHYCTGKPTSKEENAFIFIKEN